MELNLHVRHALPGEVATHVYHARTGCIFSTDYLAESTMRSDAVLPCLVSVPPTTPVGTTLGNLDFNKVDLLLGALENMPEQMFAFQDREDRTELMAQLEVLHDLLETASLSTAPMRNAEQENAYVEHEDGELLTIESNLD